MVQTLEPKVGDYVYYLPQVYEVKEVVRQGVYRICGVKTRFRTVVTLSELYPTTLNRRPPITTQENSEKLGVASLQL